MQVEADSAPERATRPTNQLPLWRRVLPFVVGGGLVLYVLSRLDFATFVRALKTTNFPAFVLFALLFITALLFADVYATTYVYRRTVGPVKFKELFVIRAAAYLPAMLNHHVGQAWLTYFVSKAYRAPIARAAGATLIVYATTFGALYAFLLAGLPFNHHRVAWLLPTVAAVGVAGAGYLVALAVRPGSIAGKSVTGPLFELGVRGHLAATVVRFPHVFVQFLGAWIPFLFFGIHIPFTDALALTPVLMFVVTLPVSPQGLGTRDALSIALFSSYAPGTGAERASIVVATTLSWLCLLTVIQLVGSPLFMRRAYQLLGTSPAPDP